MPSPRRSRTRTVALMVVLPIAVVSIAVASVSAGIRLAPDDPAQWHQDPLTAQAPKSPNWYRLTPPDDTRSESSDRDDVAPVFDVPLAELETTFDAVASADSRVGVLAGSAAAGFVTYVQRSALMGYPDYVSVRFVSVDDEHSTLSIFSRARYGSSDMGVNEKRVNRWIQETQIALT